MARNRQPELRIGLWCGCGCRGGAAKKDATRTPTGKGALLGTGIPLPRWPDPPGDQEANRRTATIATAANMGDDVPLRLRPARMPCSLRWATNTSVRRIGDAASWSDAAETRLAKKSLGRIASASRLSGYETHRAFLRRLRGSGPGEARGLFGVGAKRSFAWCRSRARSPSEAVRSACFSSGRGGSSDDNG